MRLNVISACRCNLSCEYCIVKEFKVGIENQVRNIPLCCISQIVKEYNVNVVNFCGCGETVLAENFKELFLEAAKYVQKIELVSNGNGRDIKWWDSLFDEMPEGVEYKIILSLHPSQNNADSIKRIFDLIKEKSNMRKYTIIPAIVCPLSIKDVDKFLEIKENEQDFFYNITIISNIYERNLKSKIYNLIKYEIKPVQFIHSNFYYDLKSYICEADLNTVNITMDKDGKLHFFKINADYTRTPIENSFVAL
jgi:hypothetical protein